MGPVVLDKCIKFLDPSLNRSREIPHETVGGGIFDCFSYNFRAKVDNDVISGVAVDTYGLSLTAWLQFQRGDFLTPPFGG